MMVSQHGGLLTLCLKLLTYNNMMKFIKDQLRKSRFAINTYRKIKNSLVFPLRFTSFGVLQLQNMPLKDLLNPKKTSLMKVVTPYTKNGYPRLTNVYDLAMRMEQNKIPGSFIECGTWKGGCCAVMGAVANSFGTGRKTWYMDSFEGMPDPSEHDGEGTEGISGDVLRASVEDVEELIFEKLALPRDKNVIVRGWFEDTLPRYKNEIGQIALMRLDADWYEPTKVILDELYDQVVPGGYLIFDDYGRWQGCKKAVDDFFVRRGINPKLQFVGNLGGAYGDRLAPMYFQKK